MGIPDQMAGMLDIRRTFISFTDEHKYSLLYVEFTCVNSTDFIQQFARNLKAGRIMTIYVPGELKKRYSLFHKLAFQYRNSSNKHKTRIMYGDTDFVLLVKPRNGYESWSSVSTDHLTDINLVSDLASHNILGLTADHEQSSKDDRMGEGTKISTVVPT